MLVLLAVSGVGGQANSVEQLCPKSTAAGENSLLCTFGLLNMVILTHTLP